MGTAMLIVDGNEYYRNAMTDFFVQRDFEVAGCASYHEAGVLLGTKAFDIVVVDYFIDESTGKALCESLVRQAEGSTALIIVSDRQTPEIERSIREVSPAFYFIKPFSLDNIYAVVLKILEFRTKKRLSRRKSDLALR